MNLDFPVAIVVGVEDGFYTEIYNYNLCFTEGIRLSYYNFNYHEHNGIYWRIFESAIEREVDE